MRMDKDDKMLFAFAVETGIVVGVSVVKGICVGIIVTGVVVTGAGIVMGVGTSVGGEDGGSEEDNDGAKTTCTCIT